MLPERRTPARDDLEGRVDRALRAQVDEGGQIPAALYRTYSHLRQRFLEERKLLDNARTHFSDCLLISSRSDGVGGDFAAAKLAGEYQGHRLDRALAPPYAP